MPSKRYAHPAKDRCVACGACEKVCPKEVIAIEKGCFAKVVEDICIGCGKCSRVCPAACITMVERVS